MGVLLLLLNVLYTFPVLQRAKHKLYHIDSGIHESIIISDVDENPINGIQPTVVPSTVNPIHQSGVQGTSSTQQPLITNATLTLAGTPHVELKPDVSGISPTQRAASGTAAPTRCLEDLLS